MTESFDELHGLVRDQRLSTVKTPTSCSLDEQSLLGMRNRAAQRVALRMYYKHRDVVTPRTLACFIDQRIHGRLLSGGAALSAATSDK